MFPKFIRIEVTADEPRQWLVSLDGHDPLVTEDPVEATRRVFALRAEPRVVISGYSDDAYVELLETAFTLVDDKYTKQVNALLSD